jgi:hypothetical protein
MPPRGLEIVRDHLGIGRKKALGDIAINRREVLSCRTPKEVALLVGAGAGQ